MWRTVLLFELFALCADMLFSWQLLGLRFTFSLFAKRYQSWHFCVIPRSFMTNADAVNLCRQTDEMTSITISNWLITRQTKKKKNQIIALSHCTPLLIENHKILCEIVGLCKHWRIWRMPHVQGLKNNRQTESAHYHHTWRICIDFIELELSLTFNWKWKLHSGLSIYAHSALRSSHTSAKNNLKKAMLKWESVGWGSMKKSATEKWSKEY